MRILKCEECRYERSSEQDGRLFEPDPLDSNKLICKDCHDRGEAMAELSIKGKTEYKGFKIELHY